MGTKPILKVVLEKPFKQNSKRSTKHYILKKTGMYIKQDKRKKNRSQNHTPLTPINFVTLSTTVMKRGASHEIPDHLRWTSSHPTTNHSVSRPPEVGDLQWTLWRALRNSYVQRMHQLVFSTQRKWRRFYLIKPVLVLRPRNSTMRLTGEKEGRNIYEPNRESQRVKRETELEEFPPPHYDLLSEEWSQRRRRPGVGAALRRENGFET